VGEEIGEEMKKIYKEMRRGSSPLSSSNTHSPSMSVAAWEALLKDAIRTSTG
jgi:hypothetical protein